ncbi:hypothetical protein GGR55DRAFT_17771 [Xylaria sp. FL0064]|nr:hypothetical protein GGR55DRAFT_17771 [Xylaria sp. FL0064]
MSSGNYAVATAAVPPSSAAQRFSKTSTVGCQFVSQNYKPVPKRGHSHLLSANIHIQLLHLCTLGEHARHRQRRKTIRESGSKNCAYCRLCRVRNLQQLHRLALHAIESGRPACAQREPAEYQRDTRKGSHSPCRGRRHQPFWDKTRNPGYSWQGDNDDRPSITDGDGRVYQEY